jgi:hypothetical protein
MLDKDGDGTKDALFVCTYNTDGDLLTYNRDADGDGKDDAMHAYTYNTDGNVLKYDSDADGTID